MKEKLKHGHVIEWRFLFRNIYSIFISLSFQQDSDQGRTEKGMNLELSIQTPPTG